MSTQLQLKDILAGLAPYGLTVNKDGVVVKAGRKKHRPAPAVLIPPAISAMIDSQPQLASGVQNDGHEDVEAILTLGRPPIYVGWCSPKPKGSPGRGKGGYCLQEKLQMTDGDYLIVY
ncbi:hypothetical protein FRC06_010020, partial [Ceratobasidium sp. 370]